RLPGLRLLPVNERRADPPRSAARCDHLCGDPRGDLSGAAAVRAGLEAQPGVAGALRARCAARLALLDGQRDRAGCRGQLVVEPLEARASTDLSACAASARWEWCAFQSSPSSAMVCVSPSGMNTGSTPKPLVPADASAISPSSTPRPVTSPSGRRH